MSGFVIMSTMLEHHIEGFVIISTILEHHCAGVCNN